MLSPTALEEEARQAREAVGVLLGIGHWPGVPVDWNRRLRRAGRALIDSRGRRVTGARIELSPAYFEVYPDDLRGILVHEATHVGLAVVGRPCGHGREFQAVCVAAGGLLHSRWLPGRVYRYRCPVCATILERRRRATADRWCADCAQAAERARQDPYARERALVLVGTTFVGPERAAARAQPVCDA